MLNHPPYRAAAGFLSDNMRFVDLANKADVRSGADSVEKARQQSSWNARARKERWTERPALLSGWLEVRHRYQFRQLPEVLGGGCQEELIAGAVRTS